jgi:hypothetical protein
MADRFERFVMNGTNGVRFVNAHRNPAFTAFLEGDTSPDAKHELVSLGPIALGEVLRNGDDAGLARSLSDYYNERAGIFVNTPNQDRIEMWYLMYALSLAAHIIRKRRADDEVAVGRLRRSVRTLIAVAHQLDYDFNHQGYDFAEGTAWTRRDIYRQPDAVAGYAYLMLLAHEFLGDTDYRGEAEVAMDRYLSMTANPWYEVPDVAMGVTASARLSALGTACDTWKAVEFLLDPDAGLAVGEWGGHEVTGLYRGWRHSKPESVYSLESFMALPYILSSVRYQPELARIVGAYALHISSHAHLFYSEYLDGRESRGDLTPVVAYERLYKYYDGSHAYASGDVAGHKSIYGGSYALWWAALAAQTSDPYILELDLVSSDFLVPGGWPTCLYYNPHDTSRTVSIDRGSCELYDLNEHRVLAGGRNHRQEDHSASLDIPPGGARVVAEIPRNGTHRVSGGVLTVDGVPVDFRANTREDEQ